MVRRAPGPLVAPAKPMTDTYNTPETLETELNRLVLLLEAVESAWVYAVYDDVPTRDQLIATMRERLAPIAVLERSLAGSGETSPLEFAQQTPVLPNQSAPVICFTGLGNAIMQGHLPNLLDLHREALASTRHRLVFWVRENEWVELLETARNFSSRIAGSFDFREELDGGLGSKPRAKQESMRIISEIPHDESLKESQIKSVKTRIHSLNEDNPQDARELAFLYSDLGNSYKSLYRPRWLEAEATHLKSSRFFAAISNHAAQARELMNAAEAAYYGDIASLALQYSEESLEIYSEIGDSLGMANTILNIGNIKYFQSKSEQAIDRYNQALKIFTEIQNFHGQSQALMGVGNVSVMKGELSKALNYYNHSLEISNKISNSFFQAFITANVSNVIRMMGDLNLAIEKYHQVLEIYKKNQDEFGLHHVYVGLINTLVRINSSQQNQEEFFEVLKNCYSCLALCLEFGDRLGLATTLVAIGDAKKYQIEYTQAIENYNEALENFIEIGDRFGQTEVISRLGQVTVLQGDILKAESLLKEALKTFQTLGYRYHYAEAIGDYGLALNQVGKPLEAQPYLERAIELFEALEVPKIAQRYRDALK
jgi:tetratricopeptide (TPR) repeat protein